MNHFYFLVCFALVQFVSVKAAGSNRPETGPGRGNHILWYDEPASVWNQALPIGNGRLGAMVFGHPANERIQLNEETFWSGGPSRNDNPRALGVLGQVRQLIFDGQLAEADRLVNENIRASELHGSMFQPIGDLHLLFPGHENFTGYYRDLDIGRAVATTRYTVGGVEYRREVFASLADQVIVVRLTASRPRSLTFTASLSGPLQQNTGAIDNQTLRMTGLSSSHEGVTGQVRFDARARVIARGGRTEVTNGQIAVTRATEVTILVSIGTNFVNFRDLTANEAERSAGFLGAALGKRYRELLERHVTAYQRFFNRVTLDLGTTPEANRPTDERIKNFAQVNDPALMALYFQFGRYLLISSSQPGGQPANLQGVWNYSTHPAWDSKYTININTQMNYWPAEKTNLPEMHEPLIQMVKELSEACQPTAQTMYGARGWVTHHNTDIWRICGVIDGAFWGMWPLGGAWLSQHLWERYLFNGDLEYLASVYPVLKSASLFFKDFLTPEPDSGWLVVSPSVSPENAPYGHPTSLAAGTTMDNQILFDLFTRTIQAASLLGKDAGLMAQLQDILHSLPPMQVGRYGQLQEWLHDWDNPRDEHRHVSHLYGMFPSNQISAFTTPGLADAVRTTLLHRGDVSTGWSMGWKVNLWARLFDGNQALKLITDQLTLVDPVDARGMGGTFPNMLGSHPPFQIDGNFGATSGIVEMLLQFHDGAIHFLPALPHRWPDGEITGIRTYGGFEVSFSWKDGNIERIEIKSNLGGNCRVRVPRGMMLQGGGGLAMATGENPNPFFDTPEIKAPIISPEARLNEIVLPESFLYDLPTTKGQTYILIPK